MWKICSLYQRKVTWNQLTVKSQDHEPFVWDKGIARTQSPTTKNYAPELPTFGVIAGVSQTEVQWKGLALGEPPWWSRFLLSQVSMLRNSAFTTAIWLDWWKCGLLSPETLSTSIKYHPRHIGLYQQFAITYILRTGLTIQRGRYNVIYVI